MTQRIDALNKRVGDHAKALTWFVEDLDICDPSGERKTIEARRAVRSRSAT